MVEQFDTLSTTLETFQRERSQLYTRSGEPIYVEAEQARRMQTLISDVDQAVESALVVADDELAAAREELVQVAGADPSAQLSVEELAQANARAAFVREDCERLPMVALVDRCWAVLAVADLPAIFLHARYARTRVDDVTANGRSQGRIDPDSRAGLLELRETVEALEARIVDPAKRVRAEQRLSGAYELRMRAHRVRRVADGSHDDAQARITAGYQAAF